MDDILAQHRKKPLAGAVVKPKQPDKYVAFDAKDRVERLRIRRALDPVRSPRYLHLQEISYDGEFGTNFVLDFDFMMVLVRGKNLQGVVAALELGTCDFIQEYHPEIWEKPADTEPVIESIEVVVREAPPAGGQPPKKSP